MTKSEIKGFIIDCFGVILSNASDIAYEKMGGDITKDRQKINALYKAYDLGLIGYDEEHTEIAKILGVSFKEWVTTVRESTQFNDPLVEYLNGLPQRKIILSNLGVESKKRLLDEYDFSFVEDFLTSAEIGAIKPDPSTYRIAAEKIGLQPAECVFIDDSLMNCRGAEEVGMVAVQYTGVKNLSEKLEELL